jgi:hypothetical protein
LCLLIFLVDLDRPTYAEGFVWPDMVEHLPVVLGLACEQDPQQPNISAPPT